jgi:hypothetical protein
VGPLAPFTRGVLACRRVRAGGGVVSR